MRKRKLLSRHDARMKNYKIPLEGTFSCLCSCLHVQKVHTNILKSFGTTIRASCKPTHIRFTLAETPTYVYFLKQGGVINQNQDWIEERLLSAVVQMDWNNHAPLSTNRKLNINHHKKWNCCNPSVWTKQMRVEVYDIAFILKWLEHVHTLKCNDLLQIICDYVGPIKKTELILNPHECKDQLKCHDKQNKWSSVDFVYDTCYYSPSYPHHDLIWW